MLDWLERLFPLLAQAPYQVTSPPTDKYNCIAWALRIDDDWWWPISRDRIAHWPSNVAKEETIAAFRDCFAVSGYVGCDTEELESGYEKIALFANAYDVPTHAARQLANGRWTSKLGQADDIEHELRTLEGKIYGRVVCLMKRSRHPIE